MWCQATCATTSAGMWSSHSTSAPSRAPQYVRFRNSARSQLIGAPGRRHQEAVPRSPQRLLEARLQRDVGERPLVVNRQIVERDVLNAMDGYPPQRQNRSPSFAS